MKYHEKSNEVVVLCPFNSFNSKFLLSLIVVAAAVANKGTSNRKFLHEVPVAAITQQYIQDI